MISCASSPPAHIPRQEQRRATREAIIKSVTRLLRGVGYGHFTVADAARGAGISRRTFFNYFPTLEEAISAPTIDVIDSVAERLNSLPPTHNLLDGVDEITDILLDSQDFLPMLMRLHELSHSHENLRSTDARCMDYFERTLFSVLEPRMQDHDAVTLSAVVYAIVSASRIAVEETARTHLEEDTETLASAFQASFTRVITLYREGLDASRIMQ